MLRDKHNVSMATSEQQPPLLLSHWPIKSVELTHSTVEPRLSRLFNYPDLFPWSQFCSWISKILKNWNDWKFINPFKRVVKTLFQSVLLWKSESSTRWTLFWCIQLNSDWLKYCYIAKGNHAWFCIGYVNTRPIDHKLVVCSLYKG